MLKASHKIMLDILCFFILVNKLMLASFMHNYEVYFFALFSSCFIKSYLDIGPTCILFIFSLALPLL